MADNTKIEWTDATWNPVTGCSVVSPGCTNCYAMRLAGTRLAHIASRKGLTDMKRSGPVWNGEVRFNEKDLDQPLRWRRPRLIFVCAHGDLFHENVPDEWIDRVFAVMALAPQHTFQVLTKRSARMREYLSDPARRQAIALAGVTIGRSPSIDFLERKPWPIPNVWLGVSAEDQARANERIPDLLATPAAVRFVSAEPLLGQINLHWISAPSTNGLDATRGEIEERETGRIITCPRLDWVIVGGESGPGARPMHPDWARSLRDQCAAASVALHFKQWGEWAQQGDWYEDHHVSLPCRVWNGKAWTDDGGVEGECMVLAGKKRAGRLLDGVEHNGMPEARR